MAMILPVADAPIVVTATRDARPATSVTQSVTLIDREALRLRQGVAVADLLREVPGVRVTRNGGLGGFTGVFIRGANSEQALVLVDGVRLTDAAAPGGGFDFADLLGSSIDRVEVVRGPLSSVWGSGAVGGVVNLLTRAPGDGPALDALADYGWRDTGRVQATLSGKAGPVGVRVGGGLLSSEGVSAFSEARGGRERDGYRQWNANAALSIGDARLGADARAFYVNARAGNDGFAPPTFALGDTPDIQRSEQAVAQGNARWTLGRWTNRAGYGRSSVARRTLNSAGAASFSSLGVTERVDYQGGLDLGAARATFGAEREMQRYRTGVSTSARARARTDAAYAQLTATFGPAVLDAGLRHDDHDRFGGATTASAGARVNLDGGGYARGGWAQGYRAPSLFQLFSDFGNAALRPERSEGGELALGVRRARFAAEAVAWRRDSRDLVAFVGCFGVSSPICVNRPFGTYDNVARARAEGVELSLSAQPVAGLRAAATWSHVRAVDRVTARDLPRRARQSASASLDWTGGRFGAGATATLVGASFDDAANRVRLGGYALVDVRASLDLGGGLEAFGRIENAADERYETAAGYGQPGRAAFAGVRLRR